MTSSNDWISLNDALGAVETNDLHGESWQDIAHALAREIHSLTAVRDKHLQERDELRDKNDSLVGHVAQLQETCDRRRKQGIEQSGLVNHLHDENEKLNGQLEHAKKELEALRRYTNDLCTEVDQLRPERDELRESADELRLQVHKLEADRVQNLNKISTLNHKLEGLSPINSRLQEPVLAYDEEAQSVRPVAPAPAPLMTPREPLPPSVTPAQCGVTTPHDPHRFGLINGQPAWCYGNLDFDSTPDHDPINRPAHYTAHPSGIECIEITEHMTFCLGNAVKYIWRADHKGNAIEDLGKAAYYVNRETLRRQRLAESKGDDR